MDLVLPPGVSPGFLDGEPGPMGEGPDGVVIDNQTGLPDDFIGDATRTFIEENSSFGPQVMDYQFYSGAGSSIMTRTEFRQPSTIVEEIRVARHLAERDDDVAAVMGEMIGTAFSEGLETQHADEKTKAIFCAINEEMDIEAVLSEMYREWLIASQVNTAMLFSRSNLEYEMSEATRTLNVSAAVPRVGVLASENIRVLGNDTFGTGTLAYDPDNEKLRIWLREYFDKGTSVARKAEMGRQDRIAANLFTAQIYVNPFEVDMPSTTTGVLYLLNPQIVQRSTMPKGSWRYPRPLLTRNFPLLEAKRLLNIMDFALLQGGSNFIVVAKKGSDKRPARPNEVANLREVIRRSSKTGVIVGDHRLSFEIITPKLDELLNPTKRRLIGRKLVMGMMRVADHGDDKGSETAKAETETYGRVISWDRAAIARHMKRNVYKETARRNSSILKGPASLWFPKVILQGTQYFTDFVLKLRDRGDIPRKAAVQAAGFDYEAGLAQRKRELANGDDAVLIPGMVPHSSPEQPGQQPSPNDNGGGRPPGGGPEDAYRGKRVIAKNAGETIKAWLDDDPEINQVVRMGEITLGMLEEYSDRDVGRMTGNERTALDLTEPTQIATTVYVPVNPGYMVNDVKAVRLADGLSALIGTEVASDAIVTKVLCFREPQFTLKEAEEMALRWGFVTREMPQLAPPADPEETAAVPPVNINFNLPESVIKYLEGLAGGNIDPGDGS
jgi:hypothetical protein